MAGASRLEQIRASLQGAPVAGEVTSGDKAAAPTQQLNTPQQQPGTA
jgi:hypothetical protein